MENATFKLEGFREPFFTGWRGVLGDFGHVTVQRKGRASGAYRGFAELFGGLLPFTEYSALGSGHPGLAEGILTVGGEDVQLSYNTRAIKRISRALKLSYRGRSYTYTSLGYAKPVQLTRDGLGITIAPGSEESPRDMSLRSVKIVGAADPVDLAIALIFEVVDTAVLTLGGAIATAPFTMLRSHPGNDGYQP
ncbi:hypothetical protein ACGF3G_04010 [Streptomyces sp. NPDC048179]|uniref:hypothetical protein n=1 Tax=Streptomyces sp. NPDC048179 TaxID=3365506 RepID=UPI0037164D8E